MEIPDILSIEGLLWVIFLMIILFLIIRRIKIKKTETFEDRDN